MTHQPDYRDPSPFGLLTISRAGRLLGVSRPTVRRLVRDGKLTVLRVGSRPRIPSVAIERWIAAQCGATTAEDARSRPSSPGRKVALSAWPASEVSSGSRR